MASLGEDVFEGPGDMDIMENSMNSLMRDRIASLCENPHLIHYRDDDTMYHYGLSTKKHDLKALFGKVNLVITAGSQSRIKKFANTLYTKFVRKSVGEKGPEDYAENAGRFSLFCVEHVLLFNHGMGSGSASIAFHEIMKLLDYAEVSRDNCAFIRVGTCGGIGVTPGTICLTTQALTETLDDKFPFVECGELKPLPMKLDEALRKDLANVAEKLNIEHLSCKTMGTNDFYLGQGRLDGAFCEYGEDDRYKFLQRLYQKGVRNIEMESHTFSAFCTRAGVKGAVMCVVLLNRLGKGKENDEVSADVDTMSDWMTNGMNVITNFAESRKP